MVLNYGITGDRRKEFADAVGDIINEKVSLDVPSNFYVMGKNFVTDEGKLVLDELIYNPHEIVTKLNDKGFPLPKEERCVLMPFPDSMEEETDDFCIGLTVSVSLMDEEALSKLKKLVESKKTLLSHAFKTDNIEIIVEEDRISFPWFEIRCADAHDAYVHFITKLCTFAKKQTRVLAKERKVENEREAFRCFLVRLGFVGDKYKKDRRILLRYLK